MPAEVIAYIGLGGNLDEPLAHVRRAITALAAVPQSHLLSCSSLYQSAPLGPADQPDYINAVIALATCLDAHALLDQLQAIEAAHGRVRKERWGPRTLDLDLLLFGDVQMHDERLTVPHPGLAERNFVLVPLFEIASGLRLPDGRPLAELVERCAAAGLQRIASE